MKESFKVFVKNQSNEKLQKMKDAYSSAPDWVSQSIKDENKQRLKIINQEILRRNP